MVSITFPFKSSVGAGILGYRGARHRSVLLGRLLALHGAQADASRARRQLRLRRRERVGTVQVQLQGHRRQNMGVPRGTGLVKSSKGRSTVILVHRYSTLSYATS